MDDVRLLLIDRIQPFEGHPYRVEDNEDMMMLSRSIKAQGVISPILVRPLANGRYELISGHRRLRASQLAGLSVIPAFVREMDRDSAVIALVDSNYHREHLLPSEKAFAYKMKLEAIKHQGKHLEHADRSSADLVSADDNGRQVQRIIHLTYLVPELLRLVDESIVAFTPAVNLSYLTDEEQYWVLDEMIKSDCSPSVSQSMTLKKKSIEETLSREFVTELLHQEKANQREVLRIPLNRLQNSIPSTYTPKQAEEYIVKACEFYRKHLQKQQKQGECL